MRSSLQQTLVVSLASVLKPIVKLLLQAGVGYSEFSSVAKSVFVRVAAEEYGVRGRPTNTSRISAITGISRKSVSRLRKEGSIERWTPRLGTNPANTVLHYWHHDSEYSIASGTPRALPFEGPGSFSTLVARYAGDIPPGAMRAALRQAGTVTQDSEGLLLPQERFFFATELDEDLIRVICFSLSNLASTVVHNANVRRDSDASSGVCPEHAYLERVAWTEHISPSATLDFRDWVRKEGSRFIEVADSRIGQCELPKNAWADTNQKVVGVGIYYFEEERPLSPIDPSLG